VTASRVVREVAAAARSVQVDGFYVSMTSSAVPQAGEFLRQMRTA
jgi:hypothetical protein